VDGRLIHAPRRLIYSSSKTQHGATVSDPQHRATVMELLRGVRSGCTRWGAWTITAKACCS